MERIDPRESSHVRKIDDKDREIVRGVICQLIDIRNGRKEIVGAIVRIFILFFSIGT